MRINKTLSSILSRRKADEAIVSGRVSINLKKAQIGDIVHPNDVVKLDDSRIFWEDVSSLRGDSKLLCVTTSS